MKYIVWQKDQFGELWGRHDCEDDDELQEAILKLQRKEGDILVTEPRDYKVTVKVSPAPPAAEVKQPKPGKKVETEPKKEEEHGTEKGQPEGDSGSEGKSHSKV